MQLYNWKQHNKMNYDLQAMTNILKICCKLLDNISFDNGELDTAYTKAIEPAISFIHVNYSSSIYVKELSQKCGYSTYHFTRIFKRLTGFSPNEYIIKVRIEKAKELLLKTDKSIEIISQEMGFSSPNYFIKKFQQWEGKTPNSVRRRPVF